MRLPAPADKLVKARVPDSRRALRQSLPPAALARRLRQPQNAPSTPRSIRKAVSTNRMQIMRVQNRQNAEKRDRP